MNKPEVEILIVDDDRNRDEIYKLFFEGLSATLESSHIIHPLLPKTPAEAHSILRSRRPCLVVLDMVLEGNWGESAVMTYQIIKDQRYAVALVSNNFNDAKTGVNTTSVLMALASVPKLGFLPYTASIEKYFVNSLGKIEVPDAISHDTVLVWNCMLAEALGHDRHWRPAVEGEVTFLHLTDTHFGAVQPDYLNVVAMKNGARDTKLHADYMLWTGDITEHGYPSEFDAADKFAQDIRKANLVGSTCPVSMTPGNHDLCWPLALSSRLQLINIPEPATTTATSAGNVSLSPSVDAKNAKPKRQEWKVEDHPVNNELWRFGLSPFHEFFKRLVGEPSPEDGYRLLTHWEHLGFAILELPLESHVVKSRSDQTETPQSFISDGRFKEITNKAIESFRAAHLQESVCVIVLIHGRNPDHSSTSVSRWTQLVAQICEFGNPVITLGGHEHANDHVLNRNRLTIIGAPLDELKTTGGLTLPSIGFIRLSGIGADGLSCEVTKLQKSAADGGTSKWESAKPRKFRMDLATNCWVNAA